MPETVGDAFGFSHEPITDSDSLASRIPSAIRALVLLQPRITKRKRLVPVHFGLLLSGVP